MARSFTWVTAVVRIGLLSGENSEAIAWPTRSTNRIGRWDPEPAEQGRELAHGKAWLRQRGPHREQRRSRRSA